MQITAVTPIIVGHERNFLFVKVATDEGITGIGEAGITWLEEGVGGVVRTLTPLLVGEDPFRTEHLWQLMFRGGFFPLGRIGCAALSAIDIALWDVKAKAFGVPLYRLLGGPTREKVVCYPHVRGGSTAELVAAAKETVDAGWRFVRFDPRPEPDGRTFEPSVALRRCVDDVAALREALGEDVEICVDVHTRLDPAEALTFCRLVEPFRPFFIEDPLRCENTESYRKLAGHTNVPIAAGEQFATKWEHCGLIEEDLIDFARTDVCIAGGITETLKIVGMCETHGINMAFHNPLGPVATAASLHLDLAISNFGVQELARPPGSVLPELFPMQVPFEGGYLLPPSGPGLGIEFEESAIGAYPPITGGRTPQFRRADGAFTNW
ncbi:MAG: mandelate racemase/muconate lactonizing enzyme family protein [Planctomycetaceae bacterium]